MVSFSLLVISFVIKQSIVNIYKLMTHVAVIKCRSQYSCMANKIQQNVKFRDMQLDITQKTQVQDANAIATMQFFEKEMRINVIAHKDALAESELLALNLAE